MSNQELYIGSAHTQLDLKGILLLQNANLTRSLSESERKSNGYVTLEHQRSQLELMMTVLPQVIAKSGERVIAYALSLSVLQRELFPIIDSMFEKLDLIFPADAIPKSPSYYIMGQVCIAQEYRGQGLFERLYEEHRRLFSPVFDLCITEASKHNIPSQRAHLKVGFECIHEYSDPQDNWNILAWDWS